MQALIVTTIISFGACALALESGITKLDPTVFKSLDGTSLPALKGTYEQDGIVMHYILLMNKIDKVSSRYGNFKFENGQLHAQLLGTRGVLTGLFHTVIRRRTVKKIVTLPIHAEGNYVGMLNNATQTISLDLTGGKMRLSSCFTDVFHLELDLQANDHYDNVALKNLKYWLRDAMLPSFSELFCDAMERVLEGGMESPIVQALQGRLCDLLGPEKCKPPTEP